MNKKIITIIECNYCRWLGSNAYQNSYYCRHEGNFNNPIYAPSIIPNECPLDDSENESVIKNMLEEQRKACAKAIVYDLGGNERTDLDKSSIAIACMNAKIKPTDSQSNAGA